MQLKHKSGECKKSLLNRDLSDAGKGSFSVTKYFKSYQDIKRQKKYKIDEVAYLVLHTNIDMHKDITTNLIEEHKIDEILMPSTGQAKYYRFKDGCIEKYLKCPSDDDERKDFEKRFLFAINQQDGKNLQKEIFEEYSIQNLVMSSYTQQSVKEWINFKTGIFINSVKFDEVSRIIVIM